ncbi:MAG: hypothetical protein B7Y62_06560 [Sphingomonadales bacterium 35-56-22]|jgi:hypothetical protein|uniref:hypothetical protein n=1 Tax=Sphingorhabdus sp. TaxID=1902408 RepID=UPI000BC5C2EF|nr:hypothetical protein [Sphingorhabdus sp.]OYY15542.1 MAG: hypothetical protein B7Y62_06560 [Sphingomonadales bacterium 35-56-22]OYY98758.1 MAG: hypothetical protein B7Y38_02620 [Sphingomonadales bacterium 28-56-43]OYZ60937.1 MAG: hypothetical protein B7Y10_04900 [Sphingomonadales bacterium 24-56-14]OZA83835.1 MAG: hypothetical protein B7X66_01565 [Sphingomonadales bacterium 39-57-19]HQS11470.1 hypothetical protein [Sphingorhabdus sp.]
MTTRSKIVGLTQHISDQSSHDEVAAETQVTADSLRDAFDTENVEDMYEVEQPRRSILAFVVPTMLLLAFAGWTAFFGLTYWPEAQSGLDNNRIVELIVRWAVPALLIAVSWLLVMRNSSREATRFGNVAASLRNESVLLSQRMRTVNEEIALAREFLSQNARDLESLGRQSSQKLMESAQVLTAALADSDQKAKTLETVSQSANTNLEQLRKHLPVVTSAAKDVTNQIGSAGNNAQIQIKALIATLERVRDAGKSVRDYVDGVEVRADDMAVKLEQSLSSSAKLLDMRSTEALDRSAEMATLMDSATQAMSSGIAQASGDIDAILSNSQEQIQSSLSDLRKALGDVGSQTEQEEARIRAMIATISAHIDLSAQQISEVDRVATDQTSKLAFAVSALGESTRTVGSALTDNQLVTQQLIDQSHKLLESLGTANHEISETIPASMDVLSVQLSDGVAQIKSALSNAQSLEELSGSMLEKLNGLEQIIATQRDSVDALMTQSDAHFAARHDQVDALGSSLRQTQSLLQEMSDEANGQLVTALLRVRESTRAAAESSRKILDEELAHISEQLTEQNRTALANALDAQVASMNAAVQEAIERNVELSEAATGLVVKQLAELGEMTTTLEGRIADSKNSFESVQDNSFARRMVLLTESLNSTAIDVTKILSNDITDTAWASYLKGDRGVFTRRAVRLIDSKEAKIIANHYGNDSEFREHVNRYVHDFEGIMRLLLSTRDGNAIGVTLLSSDIGKLYVALAQAIERLRK